jgi:hypothetical protein
MSKIRHRRPEHIDRLINKVTWLRRRPHIDHDVVETLDLFVEVLHRIDAQTDARITNLERKVKDLGS